MIDNVDGITKAAPTPATARQTIRKLGPVAATGQPVRRAEHDQPGDERALASEPVAERTGG